MPCGLASAPFILSRMMAGVLFDHQYRFVVNYMDDNLVCSKGSFADMAEFDISTDVSNIYTHLGEPCRQLCDGLCGLIPGSLPCRI